MTDLLAPATRHGAAPADRPVGRPVVLSAVLGALAAAGSSLFVAVALALTGWFAADAGRYGDTRDAVRVGADGWLLAHGAGLELDGAAVTALPLALTLLCVYTSYRAGRWVAAASALGDDPSRLRAALTAAGVQVTVYAFLVLGVAVLAVHPRAESDLLRALLGGLLLAGTAGSAGVLVGSGQARALSPRLPAWARAALRGGAAATLLLLAAAAFLLAGSLLMDFGTAATVLSRLGADGAGGLMYTMVGIGFVPNAVLLTAAYILGPGFAVGTGTIVSPTAVVLGPVPAFPLLAALPGDGPTPGWTTALLGVPVVLTAAAVLMVARRQPVARLDSALVRGLTAGLLAAVVITVLASLAGGAAGPGRMADVGASPLDTFLAAAVSCGGGGLLGGLLAGLWARRRLRSDPSAAQGAAG